MRGRWIVMSTDRANRGEDHPAMSLSFELVGMSFELVGMSFELVGMITGANPRTSSGPAATGAALTGRTHDRTRADLPSRSFPPCTAGAVHT